MASRNLEICASYVLLRILSAFTSSAHLNGFLDAVLLPLDLLVVLAVSAPVDLDDHTLAARIQQGDRRAFRQFFDRYHGLLYRYLRNRKVPHATAEDLVQTAFITIWDRRAQIDLSKSLRSFLFTIGYNRALNHFRDTAKFTSEDDAPEQATSETPAQDVSHMMTQQALRQAIAALPERRRAVFELCFLHDLTYRETADVLGISVKTVENQMSHALKAIRRAMAAYR